MKKILISISLIAAVAAVVVGATTAFFSDTETSTGNVISAGSLDLKVNEYDTPVPALVNISDMKPSFTWWTGPITLTVSNNPGRLYKHIVNNPNDSISCSTKGITEPECTDQGGSWNNGQCVFPSDTRDENYLPKVTWFDLEVWRDVNGNGAIDENEWNIIIPDETVSLHDIASKWIYLGTYGEPNTDNKVTIRQSFHMKKDAGNEYQSDSCVFKEEFMVQQTNAPHPDNVYLTNYPS